jgi:membrane protease YdiL (CAAX protease family)
MLKNNLEISYFNQFILTLSVAVVSLIVFAMMGQALSLLIFDVNFFEGNDLMSQLDRKGVVSSLKLVQAFSAFGLFIFPVIVLSLFTKSKPLISLGFVSTNWIFFPLVFFLLLFSTPILEILIKWNESLTLPESWSSFEAIVRDMETTAAERSKVFVKSTNFSGLLLNVVLVALIPAFGEELMFRGWLQKLFSNWFRNSHVAVWLSAFLFSLLHFQFFGFLPRMLFGALFGYVFYWSGSLWIPIFGHFLNNASVVVVNYFKPELADNTEITSLVSVSVSLLFSVTIGYVFWKKRVVKDAMFYET